MATALASTILNPLGDLKIAGIQAQRIKQISTIHGPAIDGSGDVVIDTGDASHTTSGFLKVKGGVASAGKVNALQVGLLHDNTTITDTAGTGSSVADRLTAGELLAGCKMPPVVGAGKTFGTSSQYGAGERYFLETIDAAGHMRFSPLNNDFSIRGIAYLGTGLNVNSGAASVSSAGAAVVTSLASSGPVSGTTGSFSSDVAAQNDLAVTRDATVGRNLTVTGDFTVNGTTTTVNTSVLTVTDKDIVVGAGNTDDDGMLGAGLILKGATDRSLLYSATVTGDIGGSKPQQLSAFKPSADFALGFKTIPSAHMTGTEALTTSGRSQAMHFGDMHSDHWIIVSKISGLSRDENVLQFWFGKDILDDQPMTTAAQTSAKLAFELKPPAA